MPKSKNQTVEKKKSQKKTKMIEKSPKKALI